jgi:hypothetical protein
MSKFFRVLYYYYYIAYTRYIPDSSPRGTTVFVLGFSVASILYSILDCIFSYYHNPLFRENYLPSVLIIIGFFYLLYFRIKIHNSILKERPIVLNNKKMTIFLVIGYTAFSMASIIIGMVVSRFLWEN